MMLARFAKVRCGSVNDRLVLPLVIFDRVGLYELCTVVKKKSSASSMIESSFVLVLRT
jgi:hypothetical protein